ncbi:MAG: hypothetical protein P3T54_01700 [Dehalogenimonas sp.]|uniref:Uncharacterized protein n=1 Tax=Candidatus Dehalogenimonas loeffleri TaxID=3127115 RepID=A0ABZ2J5E1_9CHLR|nr:hypothetical protein [Dehalogenimonas sp.]
MLKITVNTILALLMLFAIVSCGQSESHSTSYLSQEPPGTEPQIFAPGIVSDPNQFEWSGSFSPDGKEYYFSRQYGDAPSKILFTKLIDGKWTTPEPLMATAAYGAGEVHLTFDNKRLYFMWQHPYPPVQTGLPPYYFVERVPNRWSEPKYAGQGMFLSSSHDGTIYTSDMSSWNINRQTHLAKVTVEGGQFIKYDRLDIPTYLGSQAHPCIAPDGSYILFDVDGGTHLFVCFKKADGTWEAAIDLTKHSFDPMAGGAYISPDGKYLFFALNEDIWWVDIKVIENLRPKA